MGMEITNLRRENAAPSRTTGQSATKHKTPQTQTQVGENVYRKQYHHDPRLYIKPPKILHTRCQSHRYHIHPYTKNISTFEVIYL